MSSVCPSRSPFVLVSNFASVARVVEGRRGIEQGEARGRWLVGRLPVPLLDATFLPSRESISERVHVLPVSARLGCGGTARGNGQVWEDGYGRWRRRRKKGGESCEQKCCQYVSCQILFISGWRIRKHFFLMANRKNSKTKKLLSWVSSIHALYHSTTTNHLKQLVKFKEDVQGAHCHSVEQAGQATGNHIAETNAICEMH